MTIHVNVFLNVCIHKIEKNKDNLPVYLCLCMCLGVRFCANTRALEGEGRVRVMCSCIAIILRVRGVKQGVINVNGVMKPKSIRDVDIQEMSLFP